jgi:hypothetical protein
VQRVLGLGLFLGDHSAADGHDGGDDAVDPLGGLSLAGLRLPAGSWATATLRPSSGSPAEGGRVSFQGSLSSRQKIKYRINTARVCSKSKAKKVLAKQLAAG